MEGKWQRKQTRKEEKKRKGRGEEEEKRKIRNMHRPKTNLKSIRGTNSVNQSRKHNSMARNGKPERIREGEKI